MEIELKDAIGAVQSAKCSDMQDLISAAGVISSPRTIPYESASVLSQKKRCFSGFYGVFGTPDFTVNVLSVCYDLGRDV